MNTCEGETCFHNTCFTIDRNAGSAYSSFEKKNQQYFQQSKGTLVIGLLVDKTSVNLTQAQLNYV